MKPPNGSLERLWPKSPVQTLSSLGQIPIVSQSLIRAKEIIHVCIPLPLCLIGLFA